MVKGCTWDSPFDGSECLQPLFVILIPECDGPIRPDCSEGPICVLEGNGVHTVRIGILSMTLEGEMVLVGDRLDILDPHPSFNTTDSETRCIGEATDASCLIL